MNLFIHIYVIEIIQINYHISWATNTNQHKVLIENYSEILQKSLCVTLLSDYLCDLCHQSGEKKNNRHQVIS